MATRTKKQQKSKKVSKNFATVTQRILDLIDRGVLPWQDSWHSLGYQNLIKKKPYSGINPMLCRIHCLSYGHKSPFYLGKAQLDDLGWSIKKGSKANWLRWGGGKTVVSESKNSQGEIEIQEKFIPAFRWLMVFNIDCLDDSNSERKIVELLPDLPEEKEIDHQKIQSFIDDLSADISFGGDEAYCNYDQNRIYLPYPGQFTSQSRFWAVAFHEHVHWTAPRLGRDLDRDRKSSAYLIEELVADLGAAFLGNYFGLADTQLECHASYLKSYWQVLNNDPQIFFKAAYQAQKAVDFLLKLGGIEPEITPQSIES